MFSIIQIILKKFNSLQDTPFWIILKINPSCHECYRRFIALSKKQKERMDTLCTRERFLAKRLTRFLFQNISKSFRWKYTVKKGFIIFWSILQEIRKRLCGLFGCRCAFIFLAHFRKIYQLLGLLLEHSRWKDVLREWG